MNNPYNSLVLVLLLSCVWAACDAAAQSTFANSPSDTSAQPQATSTPPANTAPQPPAASDAAPPTATPAQAAPSTSSPLPTATAAGEQAKALIKESLQAVDDSLAPPTSGAENFTPSFGSWSFSLFFSPKDTDRLKKVTETGEKYLLMGGDAAVEQNNEDEEIAKLLAEEEAKSQKEPVKISYPTFFLHSIMYRSANDWSVWLNKNLLTNDKRETDAGVRVEAISHESVKFSWTPPKEFVDAKRLADLQQKQQAILLKNKKSDAKQPTADAPTNTSEETHPAPASTEENKPDTPQQPAKQEEQDHSLAPSRVAADTQAGAFDQENNVFVFSLRPNQVFTTQTNQVFEGLPAGVTEIAPESAVTKIENENIEEGSPNTRESRRHRGRVIPPATPTPSAAPPTTLPPAPTAAPATADAALENVATKPQSPRNRFKQALDGD